MILFIFFLTWFICYLMERHYGIQNFKNNNFAAGWLTLVICSIINLLFIADTKYTLFAPLLYVVIFQSIWFVIDYIKQRNKKSPSNKLNVLWALGLGSIRNEGIRRLIFVFSCILAFIAANITNYKLWLILVWFYILPGMTYCIQWIFTGFKKVK